MKSKLMNYNDFKNKMETAPIEELEFNAKKLDEKILKTKNKNALFLSLNIFTGLTFFSGLALCFLGKPIGIAVTVGSVIGFSLSNNEYQKNKFKLEGLQNYSQEIKEEIDFRSEIEQ